MNVAYDRGSYWVGLVGNKHLVYRTTKPFSLVQGVFNTLDEAKSACDKLADKMGSSVMLVKVKQWPGVGT